MNLRERSRIFLNDAIQILRETLLDILFLSHMYGKSTVVLCDDMVQNVLQTIIKANLTHFSHWYISGLVQDCINSSALAVELLLSFTKPLICALE